ncbi:MAG: prepilin peptidase [Eubacteriales bacterium]|nr:prepilin peptidase [Eubacteriales bacterium]
MPYVISVVIALIFIIWSVREDVKAFRIPNYLIITGLIVGTGILVIRGLTGENIRDYILGTLAGLAGMMLLYIIRAVGAGDVKLFAVIGILTGLEFVVQLIVVSLITGLLTGIVELCFKKTSLVRVGSMGIQGHGFHYAVAVLIGYVVVLGYRVVVVL